MTIGFLTLLILMVLESQNFLMRKITILDESIECFQYNYMQHHQPEKQTLSIQSSRQNSCADKQTEQTEYIVVNHKVKDEAKVMLIARSILNSSLKRLRRDQSESNLMQEYMGQVLKMVGQLRFARPSKLIRKDISMQQIDELIEQLKERMETTVNKSNLKKKTILEMMRSLESKELLNGEINQQLMKIRKETTQRMKWLCYLRNIQQKISEINENSNKIQFDVQSKEKKLDYLKQQVASKASESAITNQMIKTKQETIKAALQRQKQLQKHYAQLSSKKIPYRSEMIRCMFQVAMLCEQNYVYSLKKRHKWSEKSMSTSQASEKFSKMHENLKDRAITIDCNKSFLTHIRTLSAIYIHCQSLVLGYSFICNYSYFSTQYRSLYNYQLYERYLNILVQKTRLNKNWSRMRNELHQDASKSCKLRLVIDVRQEQVEFLRYIMQVFLEDNGYCIHLGDQKLRLKIKAEVNKQEQDQQQLQICYLKMDLQHLGV